MGVMKGSPATSRAPRGGGGGGIGGGPSEGLPGGAEPRNPAMGVMKGSPATSRAPRGGGGGGIGGGPSGGLPGGAGASGSGGLPRGVARSGSGGLPGGDGGGDRKGCFLDGAAVPSAGLPKATEVDGCTAVSRATPRKPAEGRIGSATSSTGPERPSGGDGGGRGCKILSGPGADVLAHLGEVNQDPGPFSGFLMLCTNCDDEGFQEYKNKIEALGGTAVTGVDYSSATHIVIEGIIPPGGRAFWESDGKVVITTDWINSCFKDVSLMPYPVKDCTENLLATTDVTPLSKLSSTSRSCTPDDKLSKHRHGSIRPRSSRRKIKFSPSGLYHNVLSCQADKRRSEVLYDYALRFRMYENRSLPGRPEILKVCKVSTQLIIGGSFTQMACLHRGGKSLGGRLTSRSFRIYGDDTVMIDVPESELVEYTDSEGDKDYSSFVKMIKEEVFHNQDIPIDLTEWLSILSKGVTECHPNVLSNFIYLMEPFQSFGAFVTMYLLFSSIQNTAGWGELYNTLSRYDDWPVAESSIMQKTFGYTDLNGYLVEYEPDVRGLLRLMWNCSKHRAKRMVKSFVLMVRVEYPSLLSDLQRALYDGGYLSHLKLKH